MSREKKFLNRILETNWATVPNRAYPGLSGEKRPNQGED
jgi:hypothetical protein